MEPLSLAGDRGARHRLGARRPGGHHRRLAVRRADRKPGAASQRPAGRARRQRLSGRRGRRRTVLRLADRSAGAQEALQHHGAGLPGRHDRLRPVVEFLVVRAVPPAHRCRHRRRVRRGERHDPGTDPGAPPRLHRSGGQRQLLARCRGRCDRRAGGAGSRRHAAEYGWRFAFIIGGVLGFIVLLLRRFLPESPALADDARSAARKPNAWWRRSSSVSSAKPARPLPPRAAPGAAAAHRRA